MKKKPNNNDQKSMNKKSLISSIAEISTLSKSESTRALNAVLDSIKMGLKEDKTVRLQDFGVFTIRQGSEEIHVQGNL